MPKVVSGFDALQEQILFAVLQGNSNILNQLTQSQLGKAVFMRVYKDNFWFMDNDPTAMNAILNSSTAMNAILNSSTAMNAIANSSTAMNAIANSSTAMNAILNSSTAMNAIANSSTAMNAILNSSTAMNAIANSSTAMNAIANSSTAMNAIANSSTAMNAVTSSPIALNAILKTSVARNAITQNSSVNNILQGYRSNILNTLSNTAYFTQLVNNSNYLSACRYGYLASSSSYGCNSSSVPDALIAVIIRAGTTNTSYQAQIRVQHLQNTAYDAFSLDTFTSYTSNNITAGGILIGGFNFTRPTGYEAITVSVWRAL